MSSVTSANSSLQKNTTTSLYPVILNVPKFLQNKKGRCKVNALSLLARKALTVSCYKSGCKVTKFIKNRNGAPLPEKGNYWSLSHKSQFVAAVVAPYPVGIDIERLQAVKSSLVRRIATEEEWQMGGQIQSDLLFFRIWTAKEAVLKAVGIGMKGLSACRITQIINNHRLRVCYNNDQFTIEQTIFKNHLTSVIVNSCSIFWTYLSK